MRRRGLALVTGASRGIGAAVARVLAHDHDVLLGGRDSAALRALSAELPGARAWPVELTDDARVAQSVAGIDRLDVLVHSAGVANLAPVSETSAADWRRTLEVNVVAVAELTRLLLPALRSARGHVVLINSGQGRNPTSGWGAYAASKFALRAYADVLRAEESAIRVTTVYPGRTDTGMQREVRMTEGGPYEPEKYLRPESVASAVLAAITATEDAHLTELVLRPKPVPKSP